MSTARYKKQIITIPNILSLCRLLMIPFLIWLYCFKENYLGTAILLAISGLTDIIDGYIARRFDMVSDFGKIFDPIADKLTQAAMLICLVTRFNFMVLPLSILVIKEMFAAITGIMVIKKSGKVDSAVWHGKVTTALLYGTMGLHIVWFNIPMLLSDILIVICSVMQILSCCLYGTSRIKVLMRGKR